MFGSGYHSEWLKVAEHVIVHGLMFSFSQFVGECGCACFIIPN